MPDNVTREEFDMLASQITRDDKLMHTKLDGIMESQEKARANAADHKIKHVGYEKDMKSLAGDVAEIKSDKIWLIRLVIGFCLLTALGFIYKSMFLGFS